MTVDYNAWACEEGQRLPQTSSPAVIDAMLASLGLQSGHRVLEIGTGSGFSTALLSQAVGPSGQVDSIEIDESLVARARRMHQEAGHDNVRVHHGDGADGWPQGAPYDRVIAWATPDVLPQSWVDQSAADAVIVSSVKLAPVALANGVLRCRLDRHVPAHLSLQPGSMIELCSSHLADFRLPVGYVAASMRSANGPSWISATTLSDAPDAAEVLLRGLSPAPTGIRASQEFRQALPAWLLATQPDGVATAGDPEGWGIGLASTTSAAILRPDGTLLRAGTEDMLHRLQTAIDAWEVAGRPGFESVATDAQPAVGGWSIRALAPAQSA